MDNHQRPNAGAGLAANSVSKKNAVPMRNRVYQYLRSAVLSGRFGPGKRLKEEYLARQLQVSRTPVREALYKLESEGLITPLETRGFIVSYDSKEKMEELFEIRTCLEGYAIPGVTTVSSPIFGPDEKAIGCIILVGTFAESKIDDYGSRVAGIAEQVSRKFGAHGDYRKEKACKITKE